MESAPPASEILSPTTSSQGTVVVTGTASSSFPPGAITQYAAATAPAGWLLCDGAAVSRSIYSTLFALVGTTYGVGDGSTTFNVPDAVGRVPVGVSSTGPAAINALGKNDGVALASRNVSHHHTFNGDGAGGVVSNRGNSISANVTSTSGDANNTDAPAFLVLNYIIKT